LSLFKPTMTNIISRCFGKFANHKFVKPIQVFINFSYVKLMGVNLEEFDNLTSYKSLNLLFTRKLKKERKFDQNENVVISPCDGLITELGSMFISKTMQIKGFHYKADELLTKNFDQEKIKKIYNGKYINFYLSPKDYHRYHVPVDMQIVKAVHVPGLLYSVNLKYLNKIWNLFVKNERVILECLDRDNRVFFMVFVGAMNVGKMKFNFDDRIQTNSKKDNITTYIYGNTYVKKGEELGKFEMGSTIVIFFEKDMVELTKERMNRVEFGDTIAKIKK